MSQLFEEPEVDRSKSPVQVQHEPKVDKAKQARHELTIVAQQEKMREELRNELMTHISLENSEPRPIKERSAGESLATIANQEVINWTVVKEEQVVAVSLGTDKEKREVRIGSDM